MTEINIEEAVKELTDLIITKGGEILEKYPETSHQRIMNFTIAYILASLVRPHLPENYHCAETKETIATYLKEFNKNVQTLIKSNYGITDNA